MAPSNRRKSVQDELYDLEKQIPLFCDQLGNFTFENFRKMLKIKQSNMAKRLFDMFDVRKTGFVSAQSILYHFDLLINSDPLQTLHFIFYLYDIDGDGLIHEEDVRSVIQFCTRESSMVFSNEVLDQLTRALYEDVQKNEYGAITLEAMKKELSNHTGLLENLRIRPSSLVNLTCTNKRRSARKTAACLPCCHKENQTSQCHIDRKIIIFMTLYFAVTGVLIGDTMYKLWDVKVSRFYIVAKICGACLHFNSILVLILMLKYSLGWIRSSWLAQYIPIDQTVDLHKAIAYIIIALSLCHTGMHVANFVEVETHNFNSFTMIEYLFTTKPAIGWVSGSACISGWILIAILFIMFIFSLPCVRRTGCFELFHWTHTLYVAYWVVLILHSSSFWKWFALPGSMFIVEKILRTRWVSRYIYGKTYIEEAVILPSKVIHLVINRPCNMSFHAGDYIYLNIPKIAKYEWHPFTISSAPEDEEVIWLHIRTMGNWTRKLYEYFDKQSSYVSNDTTRFTHKRRKSSSTSDSPLDRNTTVELVGVSEQSHDGSIFKIPSPRLFNFPPSSILKKPVGSMGCEWGSCETLVDENSNFSSCVNLNLESTDKEVFNRLCEPLFQNKKVSFADDAGLQLNVPFSPTKPDILRGNYKSFSRLESDSVFTDPSPTRSLKESHNPAPLLNIPTINIVQSTPLDIGLGETRSSLKLVMPSRKEDGTGLATPQNNLTSSTPYDASGKIKTMNYPKVSQGHSVSSTPNVNRGKSLDQLPVGRYGTYNNNTIMSQMSRAQNLSHVRLSARHIRLSHHDQGRSLLTSHIFSQHTANRRDGRTPANMTRQMDPANHTYIQTGIRCSRANEFDNLQQNFAKQLLREGFQNVTSSNDTSSAANMAEESWPSLFKSLKLNDTVKVYIDGPYGAPSTKIFQTEHAVLVGAGIGVTPFASILQSIMYRYRHAKQTCPTCNHVWTGHIPASIMKLKKVDFYWISREQTSFEWFTSLLSQLEIEQAELGSSLEKLLEVHIYMTSSDTEADVRCAMLHMALDLIHKKEMRDAITGLKTRTKVGRPNWNQIFENLSKNAKGDVTVFVCGPNALTAALQRKCQQYGFEFKKEIF